MDCAQSSADHHSGGAPPNMVRALKGGSVSVVPNFEEASGEALAAFFLASSVPKMGSKSALGSVHGPPRQILSKRVAHLSSC